MAKLTFTGRSGDGKRLLLVDEAGQEHSLVIDARLRRALTGAPPSNGQLEIPMESSLRPRDIQMRIRAGETPEAVAHAAGTSVEKIMPFAAPVMAERAHVAQRAQLSSVRRRANESGARTLGEAVSAHLRSHNVDPERRRVGRVAPRGRPLDPDRAVRGGGPHRHRDLLLRPARQLRHRRRRRRALAGRRRLARGRPRGRRGDRGRRPGRRPPAPAERGRCRRARLRRRRDRDGLRRRVGDRDHHGARRSPGHGAVRRGLPRRRARRPPLPRPPTSRRTRPRPRSRRPHAPEPRRPAKKRGRASVPSWDEIMFGGGKND